MSVLQISESRLNALMKVLQLAKKVCDHHEAHKVRKTNPDYIEVKLLDACDEADAALEAGMSG